MDLVLRGARLPDRPDLVDVAIAAGRIAAVAPRLEVFAAREIDAAGRVVIPGLVESHFHLDKALLGAGAPAGAGSVQGAIEATARAKRRFTVEDIAGRARRALELAVRHGTTVMRTHVEVDPIVGLMGMEAILHLDFADDADRVLIGEVAERAVRHGWEGRVCAGHVTALGALAPPALAPLAGRIRDAGISLLVLPATDLYLMGRRDERNVRRGLAPVRRLVEAATWPCRRTTCRTRSRRSATGRQGRRRRRDEQGGDHARSSAPLSRRLIRPAAR